MKENQDIQMKDEKIKNQKPKKQINTNHTIQKKENHIMY